MINGAELTTDRYGNVNSAYEFDGKAIIDIPNHLKIKNLSKFTVSLWFNADSIRSFMYILSNEVEFRLINGDLRFRYVLDGNTDVDQSFHKTSFNSGIKRWNHLCFVYDSTFKQSVYVNGINISTKKEQKNFYWLYPYLTIGGAKYYYNLGFFDKCFIGKIDEIRIYNRTLLQDEIKYLSEN